MEDKIYDLLVKKDDVTWQSIIYELVKTGEMDPWDLNVSNLSARYIKAIKDLKEHNFFISGKMVLASALLLRIKSDKFLNEHIADFDSILYPPEEDLLEDSEGDYKYAIDGKEFPRLLLRKTYPKKKIKTAEQLAMERKAAADVVRISKKLGKKMPKNQLQEIEEKLAKLERELENN